MVMENLLGGEAVAGVQMKTTYGWHNGGNGTNSSGFSGLPGGFRYDTGNFLNAGYSGNWWSSSPDGSSARYRYLSFANIYVLRLNNIKGYGYSVRCVRDSE